MGEIDEDMKMTAFEEGVDANRNGKSDSENPYTESDMEREEWEDGWWEAARGGYCENGRGCDDEK